MKPINKGGLVAELNLELNANEILAEVGAFHVPIKEFQLVISTVVEKVEDDNGPNLTP